MKTKLLISFFAFFALSAQSQDFQGLTILKGSTGLNSSWFSNHLSSGGSTSDYKNNQFNIQPSLGVFLSYHVQLGFYTNYQYSKSIAGNTTTSSSDLSIGPYIRIYFNEHETKPFLHFNLGVASQGSDEYTGHTKSSLYLTGFEKRVGLGLERFVKKRFSLEMLLTYGDLKLSQSSPDISYSRTGFGFQVGTGIILNR